jgi:hypothetical protein
MAEVPADPADELWSCPDCAFTFDAMHTDADGGYSCPACAETRLAAQLAAVRSEGDLLGEAWTVIANSGVFGDPDTPTEGCKEAAIRWRDKYHAYLADLWESVAEVPASPSTPEAGRG